jgi:hypothetical protein
MARTSPKHRLLTTGALWTIVLLTATATGFAAFAILAAALRRTGALAGAGLGQRSWLLPLALSLLAIPAAAIGSACGNVTRALLQRHPSSRRSGRS